MGHPTDSITKFKTLKLHNILFNRRHILDLTRVDPELLNGPLTTRNCYGPRLVGPKWGCAKALRGLASQLSWIWRPEVWGYRAKTRGPEKRSNRA